MRPLYLKCKESAERTESSGFLTVISSILHNLAGVWWGVIQRDQCVGVKGQECVYSRFVSKCMRTHNRTESHVWTLHNLLSAANYFFKKILRCLSCCYFGFPGCWIYGTHTWCVAFQHYITTRVLTQISEKSSNWFVCDHLSYRFQNNFWKPNNALVSAHWPLVTATRSSSVCE